MYRPSRWGSGIRDARIGPGRTGRCSRTAWGNGAKLCKVSLGGLVDERVKPESNGQGDGGDAERGKQEDADQEQTHGPLTATPQEAKDKGGGQDKQEEETRWQTLPDGSHRVRDRMSREDGKEKREQKNRQRQDEPDPRRESMAMFTPQVMGMGEEWARGEMFGRPQHNSRREQNHHHDDLRGDGPEVITCGEDDHDRAQQSPHAHPPTQNRFFASDEDAAQFPTKDCDIEPEQDHSQRETLKDRRVRQKQR